MSNPVFYLQIVNRNGIVVNLPGGGPLEADLIELIIMHVVAKGVGFWKTEKQVTQALKDGIKDAIFSLKDQTKYVV